jgi:hypothetical protein
VDENDEVSIENVAKAIVKSMQYKGEVKVKVTGVRLDLP